MFWILGGDQWTWHHRMVGLLTWNATSVGPHIFKREMGTKLWLMWGEESDNWQALGGGSNIVVSVVCFICVSATEGFTGYAKQQGRRCPIGRSHQFTAPTMGRRHCVGFPGVQRTLEGGTMHALKLRYALICSCALPCSSGLLCFLLFRLRKLHELNGMASLTGMMGLPLHLCVDCWEIFEIDCGSWRQMLLHF